MDYQSEFQRISDKLRSDWDNYQSYYPDVYDILNSLVNLSVYLKVAPDDYDLLARTANYILSMTTDGMLFSSSPICPELRKLLTKFNAYISSKLEPGDFNNHSQRNR